MAVEDFGYYPKQNLKPNEIHETAAGQIFLTDPVGKFVADAMRREFRQSGLSLIGGGGRSNAVAAVGGAVIGGEMDKNRQGSDAYQIRVRVDNGSMQTVTQNSIVDLRVGDKVRIQQNRVYRN